MLHCYMIQYTRQAHKDSMVKDIAAVAYKELKITMLKIFTPLVLLTTYPGIKTLNHIDKGPFKAFHDVSNDGLRVVRMTLC